MYQEAANEMDDNKSCELVKWVKKSEESSVFLNSIARSQVMLPISQDDLNKDILKLNYSNGVVYLKTGELLPHYRKVSYDQKYTYHL